jgi:hypothetical protein
MENPKQICRYDQKPWNALTPLCQCDRCDERREEARMEARMEARDLCEEFYGHNDPDFF